MPRDGSGNWSPLGPYNPVTANSVISVAWWTNTYADLGVTLQDSLSRSGQGSMQSPLVLIGGSVSAPAVTWGSDSRTGFYAAAGNELDVTVGGTMVSKWTSAGFQESFDSGATWKSPLYNNNGNQTFTGGLNFANGSLTVASVPVRGAVVTKSSSCGAFNTTSASLTPVTNLNFTFTATGGPVLVQLVSDDSGSGTPASMTVELGGATTALMTVALSSDGGSTFYGYQLIGNTAAAIVPASSYAAVISPAAGAVPITVYTSIFAASGTPKAHINYAKLCVTQL